MTHGVKAFDDLWVGDWVFIPSSKTYAKWEGWSQKPTMAFIRLHDKVRSWPLQDLVIQEKPQTEINPITASSQKPVLKEKLPFDPSDREIDLHIEKLNPSLQHSKPERILEYQIASCKSFIQHAIDRKCPFITIIHGKGEGVLKLEVQHLLQEFEEVNFAIPSNNGGASEVWMAYH